MHYGLQVSRRRKGCLFVLYIKHSWTRPRDSLLHLNCSSTPHFFNIAYPQLRYLDPSFRDAAEGTPKGLNVQSFAYLIGFSSSS